MLCRVCVAPLFLALTVPADVGRLDQALELQQKGRLTEARDILRTAIPALRTSADRPNLARALDAAGEISISLGDYDAAVKQANEAVDLHRLMKDQAHLADDLTTLGLAQLYLGNYHAAITAYRQALDIDRLRGSTEGEVTLLNNIGNVFYFQGRYADALGSYETAMEIIKGNASSSEKWALHRRQLTMANLATLYQRLGNESHALDLYRQLGQVPALPASERAQLLLNEGALYRRMGDPIKALEMYRAAESLFAVDRHRDGEIGALRNTGIALTMDLGDLHGALKAFTGALNLAEESGNARGIAQVRLYRAELQRRMGRLAEAGADARSALAASGKAGLTEEQWKAYYALGRIAEDQGEYQTAFDYYQKAAGMVEAVRTELVRASLKRDFLADKRDVYDSLISLRLRDAAPATSDIFRWMERGRGRTLQDRLGRVATLTEVQKKLAPDMVLLDLWMGERNSLVVWITRAGVGLRRPGSTTDRLNELVSAMLDAIQKGTSDWKEPARILGGELLGGAPVRRHVLIVPDGPLGAIPFETLLTPSNSMASMLVEISDVSYLPSAQFVVDQGGRRSSRWLPPWRAELVAFGDPTVVTGDDLGQGEPWQRLTGSADEVRAIGGILKGKSEIHLGSDARKEYLVHGRLAGVPIIHLSSHAAADMENPDRSRILLAPEAPGKPSDYLFQQEVYDLDLKGVDMVTVSGCDTARGRLVRGEGVEAFSLAFLAAGAASAVTSLWKVEDQPTSDFMKQFYYFLSRGETRAEALRSAKLRFLHSASPLSSPRYWAAFVLSGDGWESCPEPISWGILLAAACAGLLIAGMGARRWLHAKSRVTVETEREQTA